MNKVLTNLERARAIISSKKSKFYIIKIEIIEYIYNSNKRYSSILKVAIIIK